MFSLTYLLYIVVTLAIGLVVARFVYYRKTNDDPGVSEFEKAVWNFIFVTIFYAAAIFFALFFLPTVSSFATPTANQSTEVVLQAVSRNQARMAEELQQFRDVMSFILLMTASYFAGVAGVLWQFQKEKRKSRLGNVVVRPLGLDVD